MEVGDVVVCLNGQVLQMPLLRVTPQASVGIESLSEIPQTYIADGQIIKNESKIVRRVEPLKRLLRAAIEHQRFLKAILAVQDVAQIGVQASQSQFIPLRFEYFSSFFL